MKTTDSVDRQNKPGEELSATGTHPWAGLGTLLALALRRERVRLPLWILGTTAVALIMVTSIIALYPRATDRAGYALIIDNPGSTFLIGRIYRAGNYTFGVITGHQTMVLLSIAAALMGISTCIRHTREEEESGRVELLRAAPVGRHAPLTAAVVTALLSQLVPGVVLTISLVMLDEASITTIGAATFAASAAAAGLVFIGVAAVVSQLVPTSRAASGISALTVGAAFLLRGAGDVADNGLIWASPLGWSQRTRPWDANDLAPLMLSLTATAALLMLGARFSTRRDLGAALATGRGGRRRASPLLVTPIGLALRLNKGIIVGWALALFLFGLIYGPVLEEAETFVERMPVLQDFNPDAATSGGVLLFASIVVALGAMLVCVPAVQVITRMHRDEVAGRIAPLFAGPVSRTRWYTAATVVALLTAVIVVSAVSLGFGLSAASSLSESGLLGDIVLAGLEYLPAIAVVVAVAAALVGWAPRATGLVWLVLIWALVVFYFADLLDWPEWVAATSPFDHVAARPAQEGDTSQLLWLGTLAVFLLTIGAVGYRRRPIE